MKEFTNNDKVEVKNKLANQFIGQDFDWDTDDGFQEAYEQVFDATEAALEDYKINPQDYNETVSSIALAVTQICRDQNHFMDSLVAHPQAGALREAGSVDRDMEARIAKMQECQMSPKTMFTLLAEAYDYSDMTDILLREAQNNYSEAICRLENDLEVLHEDASLASDKLAKIAAVSYGGKAPLVDLLYPTARPKTQLDARTTLNADDQEIISDVMGHISATIAKSKRIPGTQWLNKSHQAVDPVSWVRDFLVQLVSIMYAQFMEWANPNHDKDPDVQKALLARFRARMQSIVPALEQPLDQAVAA